MVLRENHGGSKQNRVEKREKCQSKPLFCRQLIGRPLFAESERMTKVFGGTGET
jgi:hypothetical protein